MANDMGMFHNGDTVHFVRQLPGPIERVWDHLTNSALLPVWFGREGMEFTIGKGEGEAVSLMGGHVSGKVVEWEPPTRLGYTWVMEQPQHSDLPESVARFTLTSRGDEVELQLLQSPVPAHIAPFSLSGWHCFLDRLAAMLRGEPPGDIMQAMQDNQAAYDRILAKAPSREAIRDLGKEDES